MRKEKWMWKYDHLHQEAKRAVEKWNHSEQEVLEVLRKVEEKRAYLEMGLSSLFSYGVKFLHLTEAQSQAFQAVVKKSKTLPKLSKAIEEGVLTVFKAQRIVSILTPENQEEWVEKATTLSKAQIEKEVARLSPKARKKVRIERVREDECRLHVELSDQVLKDLRRAQGVMAQKRKRKVEVDEVLSLALKSLLEKEDPLRKAQRAKKRAETKASQRKHTFEASAIELSPSSQSSSKTSNPSEKSAAERGGAMARVEKPCPSKPSSTDRAALLHSQAFPQRRKPIPMEVRHHLQRRDLGRCQFVARDGTKCESEYFLHAHHLRPVHQNGENTKENLMLLCSAHHKYVHDEKPTSRAPVP